MELPVGAQVTIGEHTAFHQAGGTFVLGAILLTNQVRYVTQMTDGPAQIDEVTPAMIAGVSMRGNLSIGKIGSIGSYWRLMRLFRE